MKRLGSFDNRKRLVPILFGIPIHLEFGDPEKYPETGV